MANSETGGRMAPAAAGEGGDWKAPSIRAVLDSLADGVYVTDLERRIVFWNKSAERLTGWQRDDIVGSSCFDDLLVHTDADGRALCGKDTCPLHRAIVSGESSTLPQMVFAQRKDGRRMPVAVSVAPVRNENGTITGGVESFRDLSALLRDLERAREIQHHAMVAESGEQSWLETVVRNVPQEFVSGDFYRVERIDPARSVVMLADVMGHGVAAGLYTMEIRSLWEESREILGDVSELMTHMNQKLFSLTRREDFFATVFYAVLDAASSCMQYVSAAHPPPWLLRDGELIALEAGGHALGLFDDTAFKVHEMELRRGDRLLVFSDGVVEARGGAGAQELGRERLGAMFKEVGAVPLAEAIAELEGRLLQHISGLRFKDDVTMVGVEVLAGG